MKLAIPIDTDTRSPWIRLTAEERWMALRLILLSVRESPGTWEISGERAKLIPKPFLDNLTRAGFFCHGAGFIIAEEFRAGFEIIEDTPRQLQITDGSPDKKPATKQRTITQQVWDAYAQAFQREEGSSPIPAKEHFINIARLLKTHTPQEILRRLEIYFKSPPYSLRDGSRDLRRFVRNFDLLARSSGDAAQDYRRIVSREDAIAQERALREEAESLGLRIDGINQIGGTNADPR